MSDEEISMIVEEAQESMEKALRGLHHDFQRIRTGRASTILLEGISADYYGTLTPLSQMANIMTPDPRLLVVSPYDAAALEAIEKAIQASDLGLTPNNDGKVIRIPVPALTEERRKELVKQVKKISEDHKGGIREARREALSMFKSMVSEKTLSEDDRHRGDKQVQELTDMQVKKIDEMAAQKEAEILQV